MGKPNQIRAPRDTKIPHFSDRLLGGLSGLCHYRLVEARRDLATTPADRRQGSSRQARQIAFHSKSGGDKRRRAISSNE